MFLILVSVVLILIETCRAMPVAQLEIIQTINDFLTLVFIFELGLRWLISTSTGAFLREFWIDILSVMPMLRIFRVGRVLRLLRLFRIFSLGTNIHRRFAFFQKIFAGRLLEYCVISSFAVLR